MCSQTERQLLTMSEFKEHTTLQMDSQSDGSRYFAPGVTKSTLHPILASLMAFSHREIAELYSRSYPNTDVNKLASLLSTPTKMFRWSGVDVVPVLDNQGQKRMTVLEVNSCPAGQKYFPPKDPSADPSSAGYGELLKAAFIPNIPETKGDLALLWDKNLMEVTGYAMALSKLMGEKVHVIPCRKDDPDPSYRFVGADRKLEVRVHGLKGEEWVPVRAAMKYVTCSPWQRIPPTPSTFILNCPASCLAGGRNKALGGIAFEKFNSEHRSDNIFLNSPRTAIVELSDVADTVRSLGCCAVVKVPYSNAGKGVFTIVNETELRDVMKKLKEFPTKKFVIQELISSPYWEQTTTPQYRFRPTKAGYAFDIRVMVASDSQGAKLIGMFARKCRTPLGNQRSSPSGDYLKTNLTVALGSSSYGLDVSRCVLFDTIGFDELSLTLSDLVEAYVQSFLAMLSVDYLTQYICPQGKWNLERFSYLNYDPPLFKEINETNNDYNELPSVHTEILGCGTRLWEGNLPGYSLLYQNLETEFQLRRESSLGIVQ